MSEGPNAPDRDSAASFCADERVSRCGSARWCAPGGPPPVESASTLARPAFSSLQRLLFEVGCLPGHAVSAIYVEDMSTLTTIKEQAQQAQRELVDAARATAVSTLGDLLGKLNRKDHDHLLACATRCLTENPGLARDRSQLLDVAIEEVAVEQMDLGVASRIRAISAGDSGAIARATRFDRYAAAHQKHSPYNAADLPSPHGEAADVPRFIVVSYHYDCDRDHFALADGVADVERIAAETLHDALVTYVIDLDSNRELEFDIQVRLATP